MENTKFTQGKWKRVKVEKTNFHNSTNEIQFGNDGECVAEYVFNDFDALLISKAPEMLEMLKKVNELFIRTKFPTEREMIEYSDEIEQLIKQATEIDEPKNGDSITNNFY
jgi:hypothetical protein